MTSPRDPLAASLGEVAAAHHRVVVGLLAASAFVALAPECKPTLDETVSVVSGPTVLAVRSNPAEAAPGAVVAYSALYVDGDVGGQEPAGGLDWDFCEARKPLAELGPVNPECEQASGSWFVPIGNGTQVTGTLPVDACKLFGPDVPPAVEGQPQGRPVDPDATGGYYEPVRLLAPSGAATAITLDETRLSCGPGGAPSDLGVDYAHRYHLNANPAITSMTVVAGGVATPLRASGTGTNPVRAGTHVTLRVAWAPCPTTADVCDDGVCGPDETNSTCPDDCTSPVGCGGAERFVVFDVASQALVVQRESMAVAWYATGGAFDVDRTGRDATDLATTSDNGWAAPAATGVVHLWAIVRDDRGGVDWTDATFDVQ